MGRSSKSMDGASRAGCAPVCDPPSTCNAPACAPSSAPPRAHMQRGALRRPHTGLVTRAGHQVRHRHALLVGHLHLRQVQVKGRVEVDSGFEQHATHVRTCMLERLQAHGTKSLRHVLTLWPRPPQTSPAPPQDGAQLHKPRLRGASHHGQGRCASVSLGATWHE
jgi:hypothetical protein